MTDPLLSRTNERQSPFDATVASLLLMALTDLPHLAIYKKERDLLVRQLLALRRSDGVFRRVSDAESAPLNPQSQALVIAALSNYYERTRDQHLAEQLVVSQEKLWQSASENSLRKMVPWIAIAEFQMRRWNVMEVPKEQLAARDQRLDQLAEDFHRAYVIGSRQTLSRGRVTAAASSDTLEQPTWRAADLMLVQTSMMEGSQPKSGQDSLQRLVTCGAAARSLAQLMFDDAACYYVRSRSDVLGGVKRTLWDNRLGIEPAAMSLLAITRLQQIAALITKESDSPAERQDW